MEVRASYSILLRGGKDACQGGYSLREVGWGDGNERGRKKYNCGETGRDVDRGINLFQWRVHSKLSVLYHSYSQRVHIATTLCTCTSQHIILRLQWHEIYTLRQPSQKLLLNIIIISHKGLFLVELFDEFTKYHDLKEIELEFNFKYESVVILSNCQPLHHWVWFWRNAQSLLLLFALTTNPLPSSCHSALQAFSILKVSFDCYWPRCCTK